MKLIEYGRLLWFSLCLAAGSLDFSVKNFGGYTMAVDEKRECEGGNRPGVELRACNVNVPSALCNVRRRVSLLNPWADRLIHYQATQNTDSLSGHGPKCKHGEQGGGNENEKRA